MSGNLPTIPMRECCYSQDLPSAVHEKYCPTNEPTESYPCLGCDTPTVQAYMKEGLCPTCRLRLETNPSLLALPNYKTYGAGVMVDLMQRHRIRPNQPKYLVINIQSHVIANLMSLEQCEIHFSNTYKSYSLIKLSHGVLLVKAFPHEDSSFDEYFLVPDYNEKLLTLKNES